MANAWRPISLTSFLLKTLERMVDWYIRTPNLIRRLRYNNQFAYIAGVSTESAIHQIVARAEVALRSNQYAIAVFVDIKGAFSDATIRSIENGLSRHGVDPICARFISHMLRNRVVFTSSHDLSKKAERGCPQGGVLSPLLWNLVVDELLGRLRNSLPQVYSSGYADDLSTVSSGPDLSIVSSHAQKSIDIMNKWCHEVDLGIEGDKVAAILFTRKRNNAPSMLCISGRHIPFVKQTRHLGVVIDNKLSWNPNTTGPTKQ